MIKISVISLPRLWILVTCFFQTITTAIVKFLNSIKKQFQEEVAELFEEGDVSPTHPPVIQDTADVNNNAGDDVAVMLSGTEPPTTDIDNRMQTVSKKNDETIQETQIKRKSFFLQPCDFSVKESDVSNLIDEFNKLNIINNCVDFPTNIKDTEDNSINNNNQKQKYTQQNQKSLKPLPKLLCQKHYNINFNYENATVQMIKQRYETFNSKSRILQIM